MHLTEIKAISNWDAKEDGKPLTWIRILKQVFGFNAFKVFFF